MALGIYTDGNAKDQASGKVESPVRLAINEHQYRVLYLRTQIKHKQEELRIELARRCPV